MVGLCYTGVNKIGLLYSIFRLYGCYHMCMCSAKQSWDLPSLDENDKIAFERADLGLDLTQMHDQRDVICYSEGNQIIPEF